MVYSLRQVHEIDTSHLTALLSCPCGTIGAWIEVVQGIPVVVTPGYIFSELHVERVGPEVVTSVALPGSVGDHCLTSELIISTISMKENHRHAPGEILARYVVVLQHIRVGCLA